MYPNVSGLEGSPPPLPDLWRLESCSKRVCAPVMVVCYRTIPLQVRFMKNEWQLKGHNGSELHCEFVQLIIGILFSSRRPPAKLGMMGTGGRRSGCGASLRLSLHNGVHGLLGPGIFRSPVDSPLAYSTRKIFEEL